MEINQPRIILGLQIIFQVIFMTLIVIPPYQTASEFNGISWLLLLLQIVFQFILNQIYFLLSRQKILSLIQKPLALLISEVILITIIIAHQIMGYPIGMKLLIIQMILVHTALLSEFLFPLNAPIIYAAQIIIFQKIIEMTQTRLLWESQIIFYFLCYIATLIIVKSLLFSPKIKATNNRLMQIIGAIIFVSSIIYGFIFTDLNSSQIIWQIGLSIILMIITFTLYSQKRLIVKMK